MRRARHTSLAVALGLALSLVLASSASAVVDFTVSPASVNPGSPITVTPVLTLEQRALATQIRFAFNGNDSDDITFAPPPPPAEMPSRTFTYNTAGPKTITMTVTFSTGDPEIDTAPVRVNAAPVGRFTRNVLTPNVGQAVRFDAGATTDDAALDNDSYDWDFDDNGTYETQNSRIVNRSFASPGNKVVTLRVTDSGGRTDTFATTLHVNFPPVAALTFTPLTPYVNDLMSFTSLSDDPDGPLTSEQWDLDGDGQYDDAGGPTTSGRFAAPGLRTVRLRVVDLFGRVSTTATTFNVLAEDVPPPVRLRPWPKIRIVGFAGVSRVRVDLLTVRVRKGATVKVRCSGRGCPRRKAVSTRANDGLVRLRWLERRLRAGTRLYFAITYPGKIGRYTSILLRKRKRPTRHTQCLWPGEPKARACS